MNPRKRKNKHYFLFVILFAIVFAGTACENPMGTDEHNASEDPIARLSADKSLIEIEHENEPTDIGVFFNPQPEPPAQIFNFETLGLPDGDWEGRFHNDHLNGRVVVETLSSVMRGKTIHLVQSWTLHPPDPIQPMQITLKGMLNSASGKVVMNGVAESNGMMMAAGTNLHLRGEFTAAGSGALSIGGELMFNPQPEPPAVR